MAKQDDTILLDLEGQPPDLLREEGRASGRRTRFDRDKIIQQAPYIIIVTAILILALYKLFS